ncbi:hypothetical protein D3C73_1430970 [compost metagenome]
MQAHVEFVCQFGAGGHDLRGHGEGRAGRQGNLDLRAVTAFVVLGDQALAISQDHFTFLYGLLRRQASVLFTQAHGATREHGAHAQFANALDLYVDRIFQAFGEQVMVIGRRGATGQQ